MSEALGQGRVGAVDDNALLDQTSQGEDAIYLGRGMADDQAPALTPSAVAKLGG
jgi:hypothetical protein